MPRMLNEKLLMLLEFEHLFLAQVRQETYHFNYYFRVALAAKVKVLKLLVGN